jgi:molecular chaperone DnaJ/curved DNA-binding protein
MTGPTYKDYYKILGVEKSASEKQIKDAYRRLARKHHPDVNPGDKAAEEKFKEVSEAYEVLSDTDKRKKYDQFGDQWRMYSEMGGGNGTYPGGASGFPGGAGGFRVEFGGADGLEDLLSSLFGADMGMGAGGPGRGGRRYSGGDPFAGMRQAPQRGQDAEASVTVSLEDAYHGTTRSLNISTPGRYNLDTGRNEESNRRVEVKIPAGVADGQKIRLSGQGGQGPGGAGDLYLIVNVAPHPAYERKGDDLYVDVPVPYTAAALGGEAKVPTIKGTRLTMTVPPGTQSGQAFRLGGQGMPKLRGGGHGDLYARVKVTVPKTLTPREKELMTELAALRKEE